MERGKGIELGAILRRRMWRMNGKGCRDGKEMEGGEGQEEKGEKRGIGMEFRGSLRQGLYGGIDAPVTR